jgi:transposase-like protein
MAKGRTAGQLERLRDELRDWRLEHGGRGRPIPEEFWASAVEMAKVEGVSETSRVLGLKSERLSRLVAQASTAVVTSSRRTPTNATFVQLDARGVLPPSGRSLLRVTRADGAQLELSLEGGAFDVVSIARAFLGDSR